MKGYKITILGIIAQERMFVARLPQKKQGFSLLPALILSLALAMMTLGLLHTGLLARHAHNQIKHYLETETLLEDAESKAVTRLKAGDTRSYRENQVSVSFEAMPIAGLWKVRVTGEPGLGLILETTYEVPPFATPAPLQRWSWHLYAEEAVPR